MVEDDEQKDQENLVEKLSPTLHQEGTGDLSTTVETIFASADSTRPDSILHARGCRHRIFASYADAIDEQAPGVKNDPAFLSYTPCSGEHDKTEQHDNGVLDQAPSSTEPGMCEWSEHGLNLQHNSLPVTDNSHKYLPEDDAYDLKVIDRSNPVGAADLI
jgi:hypothetical protein